ncbi:DUF29 domain-containing protein [Oxynema aestuarii]|uniref:DUF29 domain-containing protein n=1 Tax=Oxynema aestuarii AP17 TaxID=2064643 RepID=A0A6H1TSD2_9CYAN|nr:DUF29 domain-containing protein [Oxynema aestuarii]QIZ69355.1 DUF29 domain-containing protein [Oxynema aestuarii AP17]
MKSTLTLYDTDYQLWLEQTIAQLQTHDFSHIDLENLIEEIKSLGKRDKRAICSYLMRLCEHLLKVKYWEQERETCIRGWRLEIRNFRLQIQLILKDSPSLKNYLQENFIQEYQNGRKLFLDATGFNSEIVPEDPCFTLEQVLDENWLP